MSYDEWMVDCADDFVLIKDVINLWGLDQFSLFIILTHEYFPVFFFLQRRTVPKEPGLARDTLAENGKQLVIF